MMRLPVLLFLVATAGEAEPPEGSAKGVAMEVERHTFAAGGGRSSGGAFSVSGTVGQADVDPLHPATSGRFAVTGGFWAGRTQASETIFDDGFEAQDASITAHDTRSDGTTAEGGASLREGRPQHFIDSTRFDFGST